MEWNKYFLNLAEAASLRSKDESTKVGCIIVDKDHRVRSIGYNGFPQGVKEKYNDMTINQSRAIEARHERPLKLKYTECAERNAIYSAARSGVSVYDCNLYVTGLPPCSHCARAIIQVGIVKVFYCCDEVPDRWKEDCEISKTMFGEVGIELIKIRK